MPRTKKGLRTASDFTEETVGFALESFLSVMTFPSFRFSIEPFSRGRERWLGADARLLGGVSSFRPFYMQFKRPQSYADASTSRIIRDRRKLNLTTSPNVLFFELRRKQEGHHNFQHNVLFKLRRRLRLKNLGDAAYVCPLFLQRAAYRFHAHLAAVRQWDFLQRRLTPWYLEVVSVRLSCESEMRFEDIPVLAEHISIPPHALVEDANHSYSFTESGREVCFHSPLSLPEGPSSLGVFLSTQVDAFFENDGAVNAQTAFSSLNELTTILRQRDGLDIPRDILDNDDGIGAWQKWGEFLQNEHQIAQFAVVKRAL